MGTSDEYDETKMRWVDEVQSALTPLQKGFLDRGSSVAEWCVNNSYNLGTELPSAPTHGPTACAACGFCWVVSAKAQSCPECRGREQYKELAQCYQVALKKLNEVGKHRDLSSCDGCGLQWRYSKSPSCPVCETKAELKSFADSYYGLLKHFEIIQETVVRYEREAIASSGVAKIDSPRPPRSVWLGGGS